MGVPQGHRPYAQRRRPSGPSVGRRFIVLVDVEEEFDWSAPPRRRLALDPGGGRLRASACPFARWGIGLTCVVDPPIATDPASVDTLARVAADPRSARSCTPGSPRRSRPSHPQTAMPAIRRARALRPAAARAPGRGSVGSLAGCRRRGRSWPGRGCSPGSRQLRKGGRSGTSSPRWNGPKSACSSSSSTRPRSSLAHAPCPRRRGAGRVLELVGGDAGAAGPARLPPRLARGGAGRGGLEWSGRQDSNLEYRLPRPTDSRCSCRIAKPL